VGDTNGVIGSIGHGDNSDDDDYGDDDDNDEMKSILGIDEDGTENNPVILLFKVLVKSIE